MTINKNKLVLILLSSFLGVANAQEPGDLLNISQTSRSFSTARSVAMGGAFTALGADGASAAINPAGIGMYKASDFSITGSLLFDKENATTSGPLGNYYTSDKCTTTPLNNLSLVVNLLNKKSGVLRGANIGFVYNRTNNLSKQQYISGNYERSTILNMFGEQLYGMNYKDIESPKDDEYAPYLNNSSHLWGGMLAYNTGLLYRTNSLPTSYVPFIENGASSMGTLFDSDEIYPELEIKTIGHTGDYGFTAGFNLLDKVYIGTTLSAVKYQYSLTNRYSEFSNLEVNRGDLDLFDYIQTLNVRGSGFGFKVGATADIIEGLKLGVAYHAPTVYSIKEEYYADMHSYYTTEPEYLYAGTPYLDGKYKMHTAPKLLLGASYSLANVLILSLDWERSFNDNIKVTEGFAREDEIALNEAISSTYKASDAFRAGAELRITNSIYARGGYAYYSSPYEQTVKGSDDWRNISCGLGFKLSSLYIDLTYVNMKSNASSQYFYSQTFGDGSTIKSDQSFVVSSIFNSAMATIGFRF